MVKDMCGDHLVPDRAVGIIISSKGATAHER
jgi:hypothetical protein